jgi:hypothetical protein
MIYSRNDIKVSFEKPQYQTNGNKVKCTLKYYVVVPEMQHREDYITERGYNPHAVQTNAMFELGQLHFATGVAKCSEGDTFNKKVGREIAEARAEAKAYKHAAKLVKKFVKSVAENYVNMALEFEAKADYVQRHNAEYAAEVGK